MEKNFGRRFVKAKFYKLSRSRVLLFTVLIFAVAGVAGGIQLARIAHAAPVVPVVDNNIYVRSDGTPTFDAGTWDGVVNSSTQGQDSNATNQVVRAQDQVVYAIEQSINDFDATNVVSTATLSAGQRWVSLPDQCLATDVTPVSSISSDGATLTCNTGDQKQGTKLTILAHAIVNTAKNGDKVSATVTTKSDTTNPTPTIATTDVLVTALFGIDVENTINTDASANSGPGGEYGQIVTNTITVRVKKGSETPSGNSATFSFTIPASNSTVHNSLYDWNGNTPCVDVAGNIGSISCSQANTGDPITVTVSGIDYSKAVDPISKLYKFTIQNWIPRTDPQVAPGESLSYNTNIVFATLPTSASGLTSNGGAGSENDTTNNTAGAGYLYSKSGSYCASLSATGDHNTGCGGSKDGSGKVTLGATQDYQRIGLVSLDSFNVSDPSLMGLNMTRCLKVDHRYFDYIKLTTIGTQYGNYSGITPAIGDTRPSVYAHVSRAAGLSPVFSEPIASYPTYWPNPAGANVPQPITEYSTTAITQTDDAMQAQKCDSSMTWQAYSDSVDPTTITAIRVRYTTGTYNVVGAINYHVSAGYSYKIKDSISPTPTTGTKFPIYSHNAITNTDGSTYDAVQNLGTYSDDMSTTSGYTNPASVSYAFNNYNIDHLNYVTAQMNLEKSLVDPQQVEVSPADTIQYKIQPSIFGQQAAVTGTTFTVEDMLPVNTSNTPVASYVAGSTVITGTNGTITGPTQSACTTDSSRQCLKWTITNVSVDSPVASITYRLKAASSLIGLSANTFTNSAAILSNSTDINSNSDTSATTAGVQYPTSAVSLTLKTTGGYYVHKTIEKTRYPVNNPDGSANYPSFTLHYENQGATALTSGAIIDVLPYNGDNSTQFRYNTFNSNSTSASKFTDTSAKQSPGLASIPTVPAGASLQYVVYVAANVATHPANINQEPCAASNLPAGFDPLTDPTHYCYLHRWQGGNNDGVLPGGGTVGTGTTPWTSTAPTDLNTVVAFRVITTPLAVGSGDQTITYQIKPTGNKINDVYCNNFSSRVPEISLEVRSESVCAEVYAIDLETTKQVDGNGDSTFSNTEPIAVDKPFTYKITVTNHTDTTQPVVAATGVHAKDVVPAGITVNSVTVDQGSVTPTSGLSPTLDWTIGTIQPGETKTLTIQAVVKSADLGTYLAGLQNGASQNVAQVSAANEGDIDSVVNNAKTPFDPTKHEDDEASAGVYIALALGNTVWADTNNNGIHDNQEAGIPGVPVLLYEDSDGDGVLDINKDTLVASTTTDSAGHYGFTNLMVGDYFVTIPSSALSGGESLSGYTTSSDTSNDPNDHVDAANDGQLNGSFITTKKAVTLNYGTVLNSNLTDNTIDFGFYKAPMSPNTGLLNNAGNIYGALGVTVAAATAALAGIAFDERRKSTYNRRFARR